MTVHHRNLHRLATEMYKIKDNLSPIPVQGISKEHVNTYDLRNNRSWELPKVRTIHYGTETIRFRGQENWKPTDCTCRLCKIFIPNLGFLN